MKNKILTSAGIGLILIIVGLCIVIVNNGYLTTNYEFDPVAVNTFSDVSIALNQNTELIITDKKTGYYTTYSDSVTLAIFGIIATHISNEYEVTVERKSILNE